MAATATKTSPKATRDQSMRRGPEAFSTLKGSTTMTAKTTKPAETEQPTTKTVAQVQAELKAAREQLAQAREAEKEARLAAKAARDANRDTRSKLDKVIARQFADNGGKWLRHNITYRALERVKAGQPVEQAIDEVLAQYRQLLMESLSVTSSTNYK